MTEVKHEHFRYVIGQQPRRDTTVVQKTKLGSCPQIIQDKDVTSLGYFYRVAGTKKFCTYVLIYHHTTAASDPKVKIPRVTTLAKNILPQDWGTSYHHFVDEKDVTKFVSEAFVPSHKISELDQIFTSMVSSTSQITSNSKVSDDQEEITIPLKKFKEWTDSVEKFKSAFNSAKEENYTVEDEIARNRMVYQKLSVLLEKHGYTIGLNNLKTFSLSVTEYARSKNDHCLIHYDHYYKREKVNIGVIMSITDGSTTKSDIEVGNAAAGVIEFKNSGYSVDQTAAEMIRIAGDVALLVLMDNKQLSEIVISGISADYKTGDAMLMKMQLNCLEETFSVKQSIDTIPFHQALNALMCMIKL